MSWTGGQGHEAAMAAPGSQAAPFGPVGPPAVPPPLHRKHGARGLVFLVLVTVALVLGSAVLAVVLVAGGQPEALGVGLLLAVLPVGPLVGCYLWLDRYEPEPVRLLVLSFFWGALVATAAALAVQSADQLLRGSGEAWSAVVVAPLTEEAGKGVFVLLLLWARRHVIDGVLDGLVYAGLVGIGFAFTENILYYAGAFTGGPDFGPGGLGSATALFVLRGVFSPFAHPLFTSAIGIGVGLMVSSRRRPVRVLAPILGYAVAVGLHATWNGSALLAGGQFFVLTYFMAMVPGFLVLVGLAVWIRLREGAMLARSLEDLAARGYLPAEEVPWLVRLPARRAARSNAALQGGPSGKALMAEYQRQAIELAALHNRMIRGTAPLDFGERGRLMVERLVALRAHLQLPRHAAHHLPRHRQEWS